MKRIWAPWRIGYLRHLSSVRKSGCLFCEMLAAQDDAEYHILYRGDRIFVVFNRYPYSNGHLMVVPNQHIANLEDLDEATVIELMTITQRCIKLLRAAFEPEGFNVGINLGPASGAGIAKHLHQHVVPRWAGDTNFMTTVAQTRVIPQSLDDTYAQFSALWAELFPDQKSASE